MYRLALEKAEPGEAYNVASGPAIATKEVAEAISHAAGLGGKTISIPPEEVERTGFIGKLIAHNMVVSTEKAQRDLNWQPSGPSLLEELRSGSYAG